MHDEERTTDDDLTMSVTTSGGGESVETTLGGLRDITAQLEARGQQLSFDVVVPKFDGGEFPAPALATLALSGSFMVDRDLNYGDTLRCVVTNDRGEVVGEAEFAATVPAFKVHAAKDGTPLGIERAHKAKVVAD